MPLEVKGLKAGMELKRAAEISEDNMCICMHWHRLSRLRGMFFHFAAWSVSAASPGFHPCRRVLMLLFKNNATVAAGGASCITKRLKLQLETHGHHNQHHRVVEAIQSSDTREGQLRRAIGSHAYWNDCVAL